MDLTNVTLAGLPANSVSAALVIDPPAVPNADFDTESYLGLWQQAYASEGVAAWNFRCVTGEYGAVDGNDNAITVENNSCFPLPFDQICIPANIKGFASRSSIEGASKSTLQVNLRAQEPQPFNEDNANYRIFGVGPLNEDGLYSWATIYTPSNDGTDYMYILVRDIDSFKGSEQEVAAMDWTRANGFSFEGESNLSGAPPVVETNWNNCN
jgi:lipocalin